MSRVRSSDLDTRIKGSDGKGRAATTMKIILIVPRFSRKATPVGV